jgi:hypothetical protein
MRMNFDISENQDLLIFGQDVKTIRKIFIARMETVKSAGQISRTLNSKFLHIRNA